MICKTEESTKPLYTHACWPFRNSNVVSKRPSSSKHTYELHGAMHFMLRLWSVWCTGTLCCNSGVLMKYIIVSSVCHQYSYSPIWGCWHHYYLCKDVKKYWVKHNIVVTDLAIKTGWKCTRATPSNLTSPYNSVQRSNISDHAHADPFGQAYHHQL